MRNISDSFKKSLKDEVTNLVLCWKIRRSDYVELCFTEADCDIEINDKTYKASSGFRASAIKEDSTLAIDNLDIEGILDSDNIKVEDILNGAYDHAMIEVFMIDRNNLEDKLFLKRGYIGNIRVLGNNKFIAEINGFLESGKHIIAQRYGLVCRANLGDTKCKVNLESYIYQGVITKVIDNKTFKDDNMSENSQYFFKVEQNLHNGYFDEGLIFIYKEDKLIYQGQIKLFINNTFELFEPVPQDLDTFMVYKAFPGCNKSVNSCSKKFNNIINFRGEPHIPGIERLYRKNG